MRNMWLVFVFIMIAIRSVMIVITTQNLDQMMIKAQTTAVAA